MSKTADPNVTQARRSRASSRRTSTRSKRAHAPVRLCVDEWGYDMEMDVPTAWADVDGGAHRAPGRTGRLMVGVTLVARGTEPAGPRQRMYIAEEWGDLASGLSEDASLLLLRLAIYPQQVGRWTDPHIPARMVQHALLAVGSKERVLDELVDSGFLALRTDGSGRLIDLGRFVPLSPDEVVTGWTGENLLAA